MRHQAARGKRPAEKEGLRSSSTGKWPPRVEDSAPEASNSRNQGVMGARRDRAIGGKKSRFCLRLRADPVAVSARLRRNSPRTKAVLRNAPQEASGANTTGAMK